MKRLHKQGSNATDQGREVAVNDPRSITWTEKTGLITLGNDWQPRWNAILRA